MRANASPRQNSSLARNVPMSTADRTFTARQIVRIFPDLTRRSLQWWDERWIVCPEIVKHKRRYAFEEVILLGIVKRLRECGMSLTQIRRILPTVNRRLALDKPPEFLIVESTKRKERVFFEDDALETLKRICTLGNTHLVAVGDIVERIHNAPRPRRAA
jgi:DNA-binding transcriptional MerR regulator